MSDRPAAATPRHRQGAHRAPRPRGRAALALGIALTWAGVAVLAVTQLNGERRDAAAAADDRAAGSTLRQTVRHIESSWATGLDAGEVGVLRIPRFDRAGKEFVAPIVDGWDPDDLARGIGRYAGGARPGQRGNVVLAGHRITHGSPFADFRSLEVGDLVEVETARAVLTYRLITSGTRYRVPDTTAWPTWKVPDPGGAADRPATKHYLTLVTCAETFHTDQRNVAVAVQVGSEPVQRTVAG